MLTLHDTVEPTGTSTVTAGARLDVHNAAEFEAHVERVADVLGAAHLDTTATKHVDREGLRVLTRLAERGDDRSITIDAGPAIQVAALLLRNETLAAAVLPLPEAVAA